MSTLLEQPSIAIVGGGACGVATCIELLLQLRAQNQSSIHIYLIEKTGEFGPGMAFGTSQPGHLLNTPTDLMGIFAREPAHFAQWMQANEARVRHQFPEITTKDSTYPPRGIYGAYLQEQFYEYAEAARARGIHLELIRDEVIDMNAAGEETELILRSGKPLRAHFVVLAIGTPKPSNYRHLEGLPNYFNFPWPSTRLVERIPKSAPVAVLGSSLSAIDTLMTFADNEHEGPVTFYSPGGLLPRVQLANNDDLYERRFLTFENIHGIIRRELRPLKVTDLFRLFQRDVEHLEGRAIDWKATGRKKRPTDELLAFDIECAEAGKDSFQEVVYSTRYDSSPIWIMLPDAEKQRFVKWLGAYWQINRHCMPLVNAYRVRKFFKSRLLKVQPNIRSVGYDPHTKKFQMYLGDGQIDMVPYLVNATGTASRVDVMAISLIQNLLHKKFIVPHPLGGVRIDHRTLRVDVPTQSQTRWYATGQLVSGTLLDTNAVWFNVETIRRLCADILYQLPA